MVNISKMNRVHAATSFCHVDDFKLNTNGKIACQRYAKHFTPENSSSSNSSDNNNNNRRNNGIEQISSIVWWFGQAIQHGFIATAAVTVPVAAAAL